MFESLKQSVRLSAVGRTARGRQVRSQDCQTASETLQKVIEAVQSQGRLDGQPRRSDGDAFKPFVRDFPQQRCRQSVSRQRPCEQDRKCPATPASIPPVAAEHPMSSHYTALVCRGVVAVHAAVPIERADQFTKGTGQRLD